MQLLEIIIITSFFSALFLIFIFAFLIIRFVLKKPAQNIKFPKKTIFLFAFFVLLAGVSGVYRTFVAKSEVSEFLSHLNKDSVLFINDSKVDDPEKVFSMLSQLDYDFSSHNSFPQKLINVRIVTRDKDLKLEFFRDSTDSSEYWVFYPKYGKLVKKEIAKVITPLLEGY